MGIVQSAPALQRSDLRGERKEDVMAQLGEHLLSNREGKSFGEAQVGMAGTDVAKRRKAFRGDTGWNDVTPHGNSDRLRGCGKCLGGDSLSPRQSLAQPSLDPTKGVAMFRVTEDWITRHPTKNGGYKAAQLRIIGVKWPPKHGWKNRAAGSLITMQQKEMFESFSGPLVPVTVSVVQEETCNCDVPPWEDCEHTEYAAHQAMLEMLSMK